MKKYKKESDFQRDLKDEIETMFPGCYVLKTDPTFFQGIPDLVVINGDRWGMLEVKISKEAPYRPNQEIYLEDLNKKSFAATIYPENKEEVLSELQHALRPSRKTRIPRSKQVLLD